MTGLLEVIQSRLGALTINAAGDLLPVLLHDGTGHPYPRAVVWGGAVHGSDDPAVAGFRGHASGRVGVTLAAETGALADRLAQAAIELLTPGYDPAVITTTTGRHDLIFDELRGVDIDWQVTIPNTNRHPAYAVALFIVHSQPI